MPRSSAARASSASVAKVPQMPAKVPRHFAVVGAGLAGIACARTLLQAGHRVTVFEQAERVGGRTASHESPFGSFDAGRSISPSGMSVLPWLWIPCPACIALGVPMPFGC